MKQVCGSFEIYFNFEFTNYYYTVKADFIIELKSIRVE